ncbi:CrcB protein [Novosphingobium sp. PhB55]|uniref:fluoride efflux transporter CrcB n=1 Tax=Novosphingobium sp. PhB55 TaxID=2485106 RepID=UPI0010648CFF|nr:fluoride efflux transporter CrcB [Novosphingobium sp. PhB55]TDW68924.1 CrcB protein [Novosphingobium sp. PhB55]
MSQPSFLASSLFVAFGGGLGSWLRYLAGLAWTTAIGPVRAGAFPYGTLTVNVVGSLAMGVLAGWLLLRGTEGESARLLVGVGVLGGFTTFSSFSLDTIALVSRGQVGLAAFYVAITLIAGFAALFAGLSIMKGVAA